MAERERRTPLLALAVILFALIPAWIFRDVLVGDRVLFTLDILPYVEPKSAEIARAFEDRRVPLWLATIGCGVPFLAEVDNGVFSPFNVLLAFGARRWLEIAAPLWSTLAALGLFLFLRQWRVEIEAATLGGIAYGASGLLVFYYDNPIYLCAAAWLPWFLVAWHRALERRSIAYGAAAAAALAGMLLGGDAQAVYLVAALALAYGLVVPDVERRALTILVAYGGLGLATSLLTAVQLLPTLELMAAAPRQLDLGTAYESSFHPWRLLELALPFAWGLDLPEAPYQGAFLHESTSPLPWTRSIYIGIAALALAPLAFIDRRHRRLAVLMALAATLATLASFGPATPIYRLSFEHLPLFASFRVPSKLWLITVFALAILGGLGLDRLARSGRRAVAVAVAVALALLGVVVLVAAPLVARTSPIVAASVRGPAVHLVVVAVMVAVLIAVVGRWRWAILALVLVQAVDVARVNGTVARYFGDPRVAPSEPVGAARALLALERDEAGRLRIYHHERLVEARHFQPPSDLTVDESRKLWDRLSLDWNHAWLWDIEYVGGYTVLQDGRPLALRQYLRSPAVPMLPALGRLGARYLLLPRDMPVPAGAAHVSYAADGAVRIAGVQRPFPRAYLTRHGVAVGEPDRALLALLTPGFDMRNTVALEVAAADLPFAGVASDEPLGTATIRSWRPGRVVVDVDAPGPRYLVLNEAYYHGWRAIVDGAERPVLRANYMAMAVPLRPGERAVELIYRPRGFVVGSWLSGLAWALVVAISVRALIRRRRSAPQGERWT